MKSITNENLSGKIFKDYVTLGGAVMWSQFVAANFSNSVWKNCVFTGCDFNVAEFDKAVFDRCLFERCRFDMSYFDSSTFKECIAELCSFKSIDGGSAVLGFKSTNQCDFSQARILPNTVVSPSARELVASILRQAGDSVPIIAAAGMAATYDEFCWETLLKMGKSILPPEDIEKIRAKLLQYPSLKVILDKFGESEVQSKLDL